MLDFIIKIAELIIQLIIGFGLFYVGWEANKVAKASQLRVSDRERDIIEEIFSLTNKAITLMHKEGFVTDDSLNAITKACFKSQLYLPEETYAYINQITKLMTEAWMLNRRIFDRNGNPINVESEKRPKDIEKEHNIMLQLYEINILPEFRKLLKVISYDIQSEAIG